MPITAVTWNQIIQGGIAFFLIACLTVLGCYAIKFYYQKKNGNIGNGKDEIKELRKVVENNTQALDKNTKATDSLSTYIQVSTAEQKAHIEELLAIARKG